MGKTLDIIKGALTRPRPVNPQIINHEQRVVLSPRGFPMTPQEVGLLIPNTIANRMAAYRRDYKKRFGYHPSYQEAGRVARGEMRNPLLPIAEAAPVKAPARKRKPAANA